MRVDFEKVRMSRSKSGICAGCGKKATRSKTVEHTVNPWNKRDDGTPKSRIEVRDDVLLKLSNWQKEPVMHQKCEEEIRRAQA